MKDKFQELFKKYVNGTLSRKEYDEFLTLLDNKNTLAELDKELDSLWDHEVQEKRKQIVPLKSDKFLRYGGIAAAVLMLLGFISWFALFSGTPSGFVQYTTDFGEVKELVLPDGSSVKLNANSSITWDNAWERKSKRKVALEGEAFFDIQALPDKIPFVVETGKVSLEVVGTSFNVDNRSKEVAIYLDEGRLNVHLDDPKIDVIEMVPGDKVQVNPETNKIAKEKDSSLVNSASWKNGILNFKDKKLAEVLTKLTNIYGKTFVCENEELLNIDLYLGVPFANWDTVKQALSLSLDIEFIEKDNVVEIKRL